MRTLLAPLAALLALAALPAHAEPYLALRSGLRCSSCHLNRTGGGGRTSFGASYGRQSLPRAEVATLPGLLDGAIGERMRIGADLRGADRYEFREDAPNFQDFAISAAQLYGFAELVPDRLSLYLDERVAPGGATNREAFATIRWERFHVYAKAGRFFLPYGWRLQDDAAATREHTGFNFNTADTGIEVGAEPDAWSLQLAVTNGASGGAETNNGKQLTVNAAFVRTRFRVGASATTNDLPGDARHRSAALYAGARAGPVVLLAEWDELRDDAPTTETLERSAGHVEADWQVVPGLSVRAWAGRFDDLEQLGAGVDWTALPGLQLRAFYRGRDGPEDLAGSRDDEAVIELHLYF